MYTVYKMTGIIGERDKRKKEKKEWLAEMICLLYIRKKGKMMR